MSFLPAKVKEMKEISIGVAGKYALLQLPGILILALLGAGSVRIFHLSPVISGVALLLWIAKDILLFPFVWRSYDSRSKSAYASIVGRRGTTQERLAPDGYVRVGMELWRAVLSEPQESIDRGVPVLIREIRGMHLVVSPVDEDPESQP